MPTRTPMAMLSPINVFISESLTFLVAVEGSATQHIYLNFMERANAKK